MKSAIAERLDELVIAAQRFQALVAGERPGALLPGIALCRAALDIDTVAAKLADHPAWLEAAVTARAS